ncbi:MAG: hypothetical protein KC502_15930 [Myxococcales bacterium]|nr:hypothetical protein [Myxococcales bacterium]
MRARIAGGLTVFALIFGAGNASAAKWRLLYKKEGVTVTAKDRPNFALPVLRGVGVLPTNLYALLAIVDDVPRHKEWVYRLETSRLLSRPDPLHARAYLRFDFPWPTSDRDGIIDVVVTRKWAPHHEIKITFRRTVDRRMRPVDGVVRVPRTIGFTRLRWLSPNRTQVIYQIDTDPGGSLPKWLVGWISEDLPLRIVRGLRKQLIRRRGLYGKFMRVWDPRLTVQPDTPQQFILPGVDAKKLPRRSMVMTVPVKSAAPRSSK